MKLKNEIRNLKFSCVKNVRGLTVAEEVYTPTVGVGCRSR
jgi:hypothetical protein